MNDGILTLSADHPITKSNADILGYGPFAQNIATILDNATTREDCLVLGIHGEWGSGKTSAINLVVDKLKELQINLPENIELFDSISPLSSTILNGVMKQKTTIVHFSPWLFSGQENLTFTFFHELEKQLNGKKWEATKGYLKQIASFTLLTAGSVINPYIHGAKAAAKTLKELIDQTPSLEKTKKRLQGVLKEQKNPLLIIIDDIDRLPADEMRQIFRMVKSVADLPYITYFLAFDRKTVERALEKDTDPEGPQWIEKIVQGSFDLPLILQPRLEFYFKEKLNKQLNDLYRLLFENEELSFYLYPFF